MLLSNPRRPPRSTIPQPGSGPERVSFRRRETASASLPSAAVGQSRPGAARAPPAGRRRSPLPVAMCGADGVALRDGRALVVDQFTFPGVERYFYNSSDEAFVYDPKTRAWSVTGGLAGGGTGALMLSDGRVMVPELQQGATQGRTYKQLVGGQIFDPETDQWTYASTTSLMMPLGYMFSGGLPVVVSLPNGSALVILQTDVLAFHPRVAPRSTQLLDSTGLTFELGAALLVIAILLVIAYRRASRSDLTKLQ